MASEDPGSVISNRAMPKDIFSVVYKYYDPTLDTRVKAEEYLSDYGVKAVFRPSSDPNGIAFTYKDSTGVIKHSLFNLTDSVSGRKLDKAFLSTFLPGEISGGRRRKTHRKHRAGRKTRSQKK